jgi:isoamylase
VTLRIERGEPLPLGLSLTCDGLNFAVFSRNATLITLVLFNEIGQLAEEIPLVPDQHRTGDVWHVRLTGVRHERGYALRADGPWCPEEGHRFNGKVLLLDPYATAVSRRAVSGANEGPGTIACYSGAGSECCVADDHGAFDWQNDRPPRHAWRNTIIYETHVRGLTIDPSSAVGRPGCYLGLVEKIPYLRDLGITAIELMPVQEFYDVPFNRGASTPLRNYWGYAPVALFAPKVSYASGNTADAARVEFKMMVRELHKADIEIMLDVVFNHTAEGGEDGPTLSFRGLDNSIYYLLDANKRYIDYTGCGNTLNCNHPVVRSLIIDCLRHWVSEFHVDGFRFDLASILGRDVNGKLLANPPLLEQIAEDPVLRQVKLVAEAWDGGGAFQVGRFPGQRWAEWNCCFRDHVRRFWRGDPGMTGAFATRLGGSSDIFRGEQETPVNSINFVTCHDGFTMNDLVSFARKHNEANGENGRDGVVENYSDNFGVEGPSDGSEIQESRLRQIKNFMVTLFVSRGIPMLLGGDEFRRTQRGNNNAYCQDNETSWYDWRLAISNADLIRFVKGVIALRKEHPVLSAERFYLSEEISWFGPEGEPPDWHGMDNRLGCVIREDGANRKLCMLFNAAAVPTRFALPSTDGEWRMLVDTSRSSPDDLPNIPVLVISNEVMLVARSAMILSVD